MENLGSLLSNFIRIFSETSVPFYPDMSFLELYLAFLVWSVATWVFWRFLGHLRASAYSSGRPKKETKNKKGGGD